MKKILILAIIFFCVCVLAFFLWLRFGSSGYIASVLEKSAREYTGSPLEMEKSPEVHIFPPGLVLTGIHWQNPDKSQSVSISALTLAPDVLPLLSGQLIFKEIIAEKPVVSFSGSEADFSDSADKPKNIPSSQNSGKNIFPEIDKLIIHKANVNIKLPSGEIQLNDANFQGENLRNRQEALLSGDFILDSDLTDGTGAKNRLAGNMAFRCRARFYEPNLTFRQGSVSFTATEGDALTWLSPVRLNMDGAYNFENSEMRINSATLSGFPGKLALKGLLNGVENEFEGDVTLELDMAKVLGDASKDATEENYSPVIFSSPVKYKDSTFNLKEVVIKGEVTEGAGQLVFSLPTEKNISALSGDLNFRKLNIMSAHAESGKRQIKNTETVKTAPPYRSFPQLDLKLKAEHFTYGNFVSQNATMELKGGAGAYEVRNAQMDWAGGSIDMEGTANLPKKYFSIKSNGHLINAGQALKETGFSGFTGGSADFATNLSSRGMDLYAIGTTLQGTAEFTAKDVKINLFEKVASFLPPENSMRRNFPDTVQLFSARLDASDGNMKIDPLKLEAKNFQASGNGNYLVSSGQVDGNLTFKIGSISLPLKFAGPADNISWSLGGGFFRQLLKDLP